jgi:hypothetical protein
MSRDESLEVGTAEPHAQPQAPATAVRADHRIYGSLLGVALIGAEIVWLCALGYVAYRLIV